MRTYSSNFLLSLAIAAALGVAPAPVFAQQKDQEALQSFSSVPPLPPSSEQAPPVKKRPQPLSMTTYQLKAGGFLAGAYYNSMADQVMKRPKVFDFGSFRFNYSGTSQYDPVGDKLKERILDLAYEISQEPDPARKKRLQKEYGGIVAAHLANIDVVTLALSLARENPVYGDAPFFEWLRANLVQSILDSGDGSTLSNAYDLVTMGEQGALLNALKVSIKSTKTEHSADLYYTMYEVTDPKARGPYTIFANVSRPMTWLESKKQESDATVRVQKQ